MSDRPADFVTRSLEGGVALDAIDDFVAAWHAAPGGVALHRFLGLSEAEYARWVADPDALEAIIRARRRTALIET